MHLMGAYATRARTADRRPRHGGMEALDVLAGLTAHSLGAKAQQGKEVRQVHKTLSFASLGIYWGLPRVLLVQQSV